MNLKKADSLKQLCFVGTHVKETQVNSNNVGDECVGGKNELKIALNLMCFSANRILAKDKFDALLEDPMIQSEFDRRMTQAMQKRELTLKLTFENELNFITENQKSLYEIEKDKIIQEMLNCAESKIEQIKQVYADQEQSIVIRELLIDSDISKDAFDLVFDDDLEMVKKKIGILRNIFKN